MFNSCNNGHGKFWFKPNLIKLLFAIPLMLILFEGCADKMYNHFKIDATTNDGRQIDGAISREKYIIVHDEKDVWHLKRPDLNEKTGEIFGIRTPLTNNHLFYKKIESSQNLNYNRKEGSPENEVHIYISEFSIDENNAVVISVGSINRLDVYDKNRGKNAISYSLTAIGSYLAFILIISLFSLLLF